MKKYIGLFLLLVILSACSDESKSYTIEDAEENGDVVIKEDGNTENLEELLSFIENVEKGTEDDVSIATYRSGKPMMQELIYDGSSIELTTDTQSLSCGRIVERSGIISLRECDGTEENLGIAQVSEYEINRVKAKMKE
ncbi:DUF4362 domain-containing protein [Thalassobacillus hwangdonensis]|uniref:DUF4362 domain-containing protein n=1 Tax=Thalassobacillus hwangdonensis TaxID=546108 RepID=A0ABW3L4X2_9BACI